MRILLTANASYSPPRGGSTRSNLAWLRHLAAKGHACRVVSLSLDQDTEAVWCGIEVRGVRHLTQRATALSKEIHTFQPDFVLVSSEDLSHVLLRVASRAAVGRIVYLAHTPQFFPFGPESWNPDAQAAELLKTSRQIVCIGHHMAGHVKEQLGIDAEVIHPPIYGSPFTRTARFENGGVLMINPCQVKGLEIFVELARRFPTVSFAALTGWGTTSKDREVLRRVPNIRILETVPKIDEVLAQTSVLLMPSLWYEGFGLIAMEAMLRGIPVVSSDSGGLREAKQGTGFVIPVQPITRYLPEFDEVHMPVPVIPEQDLEPWVVALLSLLGNRDAWEQESERSFAAALRFVSKLDATDFERMLESVTTAGPARVSFDVRALTPEQRAILLRRVRERALK